MLEARVMVILTKEVLHVLVMEVSFIIKFPFNVNEFGEVLVL